jgi:hypothetical protein
MTPCSPVEVNRRFEGITASIFRAEEYAYQENKTEGCDQIFMYRKGFEDVTLPLPGSAYCAVKRRKK